MRDAAAEAAAAGWSLIRSSWRGSSSPCQVPLLDTAERSHTERFSVAHTQTKTKPKINKCIKKEPTEIKRQSQTDVRQSLLAWSASSPNFQPSRHIHFILFLKADN